MHLLLEIELDNTPGRGCWVTIKRNRKPVMRFYTWAHLMPTRKDTEQDDDYVWRVIENAELLRFDTNGKSLKVRQS